MSYDVITDDQVFRVSGYRHRLQCIPGLYDTAEDKVVGRPDSAAGAWIVKSIPPP